MSTTRTPSPRFRRRAEKPNIQLTEDDLLILQHVHRNRVLDAASIYSLFPERSSQVISRRLWRLWQASYLDRPPQQNSRLRQRLGSEPLVYALDREGARVLREQLGVPVESRRWNQKNRDLKHFSIQHSIAISRFMVELEVSARAHGDARVIAADEILRLAGRTQRGYRGSPLTLRAPVEWHGYRAVEGTAPDQLFGITIAGETQYLALEIDQGTETIEPNARKLKSPAFWRDTSLLRKFVIYSAAHRAELYRTELKLPRPLRVLVVTTNSERVARMQEAHQRHLSLPPYSVRPGLFLFTDWNTVKNHAGDFLKLPLTRADGKTITLAR